MKFRETAFEGADTNETDPKVEAQEVSGVEKCAEDSPDTSDSRDNRAAFKAISDYYGRHNYGPEHFKQYSQDPEWRKLFSEAYPDKELPPVNANPENSHIESDEYRSIVKALEERNVDYRPIERCDPPRDPKDIVERVSGGDLTEGSCSSLAFAYAGNRAGYDVLDFRDGESRTFFSLKSSIEEVASLPDVQSTIVVGENDFESVDKMLENVEDGKEYYLATGQHAAIIRSSEGKVEYLELQHPLKEENGWHTLDPYALSQRFGCKEERNFGSSNFLIDVASLSKSEEFLSILGYINTDYSEQRKGEEGDVR